MNEEPAAAKPHSPELARVIDFFETIDPPAAARIDAIYAPDAWFKDPFNEVRGTEAIRRVFVHMFVQVDAPRFRITQSMQDGESAFLTWDFHFRMKRLETRTGQTIRGATHLRFAADGRIAYHRDYWDAAEELYEKLPLVGALMRWLKRQAG
jgi:steroid Delta-isomerase